MPPTDPIIPARRRVFESVFSPASLEDFTTNRSAIGPTSSSPFSSKSNTSQPRAQYAGHRRSRSSTASQLTDPASTVDEPWHDQATWDRAWRAATRFLSVPDRELDIWVLGEDAEETRLLRHFNRHTRPSKDVSAALAFLTAPLSQGGPDAAQRSIIDWYGYEIRRHFLKNFRGSLHMLLNHPEQDQLLQKIVHCLQFARRIYFSPLVEYVLPLLSAGGEERALIKLRRGFHMMVAYALPWPQFSVLLTRELARDSLTILGIDTLTEEIFEDALSVENMEIDHQYSVSYQDWRDAPSDEFRLQMMSDEGETRVAAAREKLLSLLHGLQLVGLGGEKAQKVFAGVMNAMMSEFIRTAYANQWEGPSLASSHLRHWIENVFARLVVQVLSVINVPESGQKEPDQLDVNLNDVEKWQEIGISRLGSLRTSELFDVIVEWPASSGAIEDLRHFITYPAARSHLTHSFVATLNRRLLHPGASTVEILQVYISIIRSFNLLDPKGVLLDRIARPIRRYLRDRDDTVRVIVGGLLADPADADAQASSSGDKLVELSAELTKAHQNSLRGEKGELDWDDMSWVPDPVDAAPDYRKSKTSDVIGSLISLFESKEMFVKEMQNMLADRLLQKRADYDQEMSVLELLKLRFGDNALQACEVMLRDIFDSRRVDAVVRNDQGLARKQSAATPSTPAQGAKRPAGRDIPDLHAKILSHFFWPDIQEQEFHVPEDIVQLQQRYAAGFGSLKQSRKLTWLNGLGQVTVELDLEDRVFVNEVTTWQATVIYAFQSPSGDSKSLTIEDLAAQLSMSPSLVRSACLFWVSKRILIEGPRDTYRVLEVLPNEGDETAAPGSANIPGADDDGAAAADAAQAAAAADAAAAAAAKESAEAAAMEKMNLYWQFIVGMLTNQGAMPLQRIVMMLKIAVPGGFPFSNEELREFLAGMVSRGKLEIVSGGSYKIVQ
ncbi:anaphase-promoting complex subunit ApcB [Aspergillus campestris IBT 28561]|uniref:Anaphase-promoting complex subunit 2 n=1 Tax=Aspergillus campestris (strain IBT 28561) TaxID=1392248 RepID=A0A2I1D049_ASPC2|nr:anaphase-promoting complex subunit ApcB [Aspergillus campestris IBT 28561]PKY03245.1 anaphase-promoting complex subunit ApcB [Aspergillus campestris IBT 28561]